MAGVPSLTMVLVWRGWGAFVCIMTMLGGMFAGIAVGTSGALRTSPPGMTMLCIGLGLVVAGEGNYLLGRHLNVTKAAEKAEQFRSQRAAELALQVRLSRT